MRGSIICVPEDLSHGPLDDGLARIDYMRARFDGYDDWDFAITDAFAPWREMLRRVESEKPGAILIWSGDNVSEATFLAMACLWLLDRPEPQQRIILTGTDAGCYVAEHAPAELASMAESARELTSAERNSLAEDFSRIRDETGLLRRWANGRILGIPEDHYDSMLLASCPERWTPAARVVGRAMGACDRHNRMSDLFFASRLGALIGAGHIEADAPRTRLRDYGVRRRTT